MIGNEAVIKNAYIQNTYNNYTYLVGLFSAFYEGATVWDLNVENAIYQSQISEYSPYMGTLAAITNYRHTIINCDFSYSLNCDSLSNLSHYGLICGYPNSYN